MLVKRKIIYTNFNCKLLRVDSSSPCQNICAHGPEGGPNDCRNIKINLHYSLIDLCYDTKMRFHTHNYKYIVKK